MWELSSLTFVAWGFMFSALYGALFAVRVRDLTLASVYGIFALINIILASTNNFPTTETPDRFIFFVLVFFIASGPTAYLIGNYLHRWWNNIPKVEELEADAPIVRMLETALLGAKVSFSCALVVLLFGLTGITEAFLSDAQGVPSGWKILTALLLVIAAAALLIGSYFHLVTPEPQPEEPPATIEPKPELEPIAEPEKPILRLPHEMRTEHMMVLARTGAGKSELFKQLFENDLEENCTIIVIDSQPGLIADLLHVTPHNRLVHLTPADRKYPLALNLFDKRQDSALIEYIFESQDQKLTPNQATVYRMVARLVGAVGGNLNTMREILEPGGADQYAKHFDEFPAHVQSFFKSQYDKDRMYQDARQAILRRINALLEVPMFAAMFTAPQSKVNLPKLINDRRVILIETAKRTLTGEAFQIYGRFFIAQIARAIFSREHPYPHRVYIYIDEAQEYFADEGMMIELFTQARKFNVGIIVAFQNLAQLPDKLSAAIMSNTAIKSAGILSVPDMRVVAAEMGLEPYHFEKLRKGQFMMSFDRRDQARWEIELGRMSRLPKRSRDELELIRHQMRERYSYQPEEPAPKPKDDGEPVEASEW